MSLFNNITNDYENVFLLKPFDTGKKRVSCSILLIVIYVRVFAQQQHTHTHLHSELHNERVVVVLVVIGLTVDSTRHEVYQNSIAVRTTNDIDNNKQLYNTNMITAQRT